MKKFLKLIYNIFIGTIIELIKRLLVLVKIAGWIRATISITLAVSIIYCVSIYSAIMYVITHNDAYITLGVGWIAMWAMPFPPAFLSITVLSSIILFTIAWGKINKVYPKFNMRQFVFEMVRIDSVLSNKKE